MRARSSCGIDRTPVTLGLLHAAIAVESDHEQVGLRSRKREALDVPGVQQVEASVGESDAPAGVALALERGLQFVRRMILRS